MLKKRTEKIEKNLKEKWKNKNEDKAEKQMTNKNWESMYEIRKVYGAS